MTLSSLHLLRCLGVTLGALAGQLSAPAAGAQATAPWRDPSPHQVRWITVDSSVRLEVQQHLLAAVPTARIVELSGANLFMFLSNEADIIRELRAQSALERRDIVFARVDGRDLALDLYLPATTAQAPLLVWVHGGAWNSGDKTGIRPPLVQALRRGGVAVASINFRQASEARFPAQVHDIKAAIRFLRAMAPAYGFRSDRIAVAGGSSGAHLAALVGVTNGHRELEGTVGDHLNQSSSVQAIVSYFGASNLETILAQSTPFGLSVRRPALEQLLGALPDQAPELARLASPVAHVDATDPPLFLLHGDQDPQMPIDQSYELERSYSRLGLDVQLHVIHGAVHGDAQFFQEDNLQPVVAFLQRTLK